MAQECSSFASGAIVTSTVLCKCSISSISSAGNTAKTRRVVHIYLVIVSVPNEREARLFVCLTRSEAAHWIKKIKDYEFECHKANITGEVFDLGDPVESIT